VAAPSSPRWGAHRAEDGAPIAVDELTIKAAQDEPGIEAYQRSSGGWLLPIHKGIDASVEPR